MAKINTGTITADGSGNWSSNAIALTPGSKRTYMRVNGTQVLYRDFTVAGVVIESGYPKNAYKTNVTSTSGDYVEVTGITTAAASTILVVFAVNTNGADTRSSNPPTITHDTGLTFTRVTYNDAFRTTYDGSVAYIASSAGALSNKYIRFARAAGTDYASFTLTVYSLTGAASTVNQVNARGWQSNVTAVPQGPFRPTAVGSLVVWAAGAATADTGMIPSGTWDTGIVGTTVTGLGVGHQVATSKAVAQYGVDAAASTYRSWSILEVPPSGVTPQSVPKRCGVWSQYTAASTTVNVTGVTTVETSGLLVVTAVNSGADTALTGVAATGLTFTKQTATTSGSADWSVDIWTAPFSSALSNLTVTTTTGASRNTMVSVAAYTNVNATPVGNIQNPVCSNSAAPSDISITTSVGSILVGACFVGSPTGTIAPNSNVSVFGQYTTYIFSLQTTWCDAGTSTIGFTGLTASNSVFAAIEIKAA